ncbi:hypothetical protein BG011_009601 [Mortierella polycephala]|uniref:Uncharacterized protein n=1 Tax=Mortierella polycephala TaxID=41804 RepID=A0A9P6PL20_9FUNG|nr:hypothetical protein BG011_009601 [Mortierella polycephala]
MYHFEQTVRKSRDVQPSTALATPSAMQPLDDYLHRTNLKNFRGSGLFHLREQQDPNIKNELFIACDEERMLVYSTNHKWDLLHTITVGCQWLNWRILGRQDKYLAVHEPNHGVISVRNIELGSIISFGPGLESESVYRDATAAISSDGKIMVMYMRRHTGVFTSYWIATGTKLGSYILPVGSLIINGIKFTNNDTQILATFVRGISDHVQGATGLILDAPGMTAVGNTFIPQAGTAQNSHTTGSSTAFYSVHGATLDLVPSHPLPRTICTAHCLLSLTPLKDSQLVTIKKQSSEFTAPSGLHYKFELQGQHSTLGVHILVSISGKEKTPIRRIAIQTPYFGYSGHTIALLRTSRRLVYAANYYIIVWQLPASLDGDLKLEVIRCIKRGLHQMNWKTCVHCELYKVTEKLDEVDDESKDGDVDANEDANEDADVDQDQDHGKVQDQGQDGSDNAMQPCHMERRLYLEEPVRDIFQLVRLFGLSDAVGKMAFLQYVSPHVNSHHDPDYPSDTLMTTICRHWYYFDDKRSLFLPELLSFPSTQWILRPDTVMDSNPLWILLEKAKKEPRFMLSANIIINYCFPRARAEKDLGYLFPVLQCLNALVDPMNFHSNLATHVLKRFAFLPVKYCQYIIEHHIIAHPPEFRWQFWKSDIRPLYQCKDPILQLANDSKHDALNENFTRILCVAPFALLWQYKGDTVYWSDRPSAPPKTTPSWTRMFFAFAWYKCKLVKERRVQCHKFAPEMLDNPAIVALIEYKCAAIIY